MFRFPDKRQRRSGIQGQQKRACVEKMYKNKSTSLATLDPGAALALVRGAEWFVNLTKIQRSGFMLPGIIHNRGNLHALIIQILRVGCICKKGPALDNEADHLHCEGQRQQWGRMD